MAAARGRRTESAGESPSPLPEAIVEAAPGESGASQPRPLGMIAPNRAPRAVTAVESAYPAEDGGIRAVADVVGAGTQAGRKCRIAAQGTRAPPVQEPRKRLLSGADSGNATVCGSVAPTHPPSWRAFRERSGTGRCAKGARRPLRRLRSRIEKTACEGFPSLRIAL